MNRRDSIKVITSNGTGEIVEKKSRFIANTFYVESVEEAESMIAQLNKKYYDARHNCYAYVIGDNCEITKCSDNGEPSGTAGKPILEVITGAGLTNILIVVTRYFGGVLLGTGGLVRAYTQAAQAGVAASQVGEKVYGRLLAMTIDYGRVGAVQYYLAQNDISIRDSQYAADVRFEICVREPDAERVQKDLIQKCDGQIKIEEMQKGFFMV
jgi:uncharacterized YigZ family protein